jgi:hypothetical protein
LERPSTLVNKQLTDHPKRYTRDAKGRFVKGVKPPPLSKQQLGDLTALTVVEEAEPAHCLELTDTYTVHDSWWQGRPPTGEHPA